MDYKKISRKLLAAAASLSMTVSPLTSLAVQAAGWVDNSSLQAGSEGESAPVKDDVLPDANQFRYQKDELAIFCHFGPNTYNEIEWGENYGDQAPSVIFPVADQDFKIDEYVKVLKDGGFKKLIITAKHHDGFILWDSQYSDYTVAAAGYKNGKGDVLAEVSAACSKYGLDMGLYLSPWDIHEPSYGYYDANGNATTKENDVLDYNEFYNNTLIEILSQDKYGRDGHFVEVWMDGAKGSGANAQEYDFDLWFNTIQKYEGKAAGYDADCMLFGSADMTTVRWIGNELGYAAEDTWSKSKVDHELGTIDSNKVGSYTVGYEDGNQWTVPECDARITSGWFWGTKKKTPKSATDLANMYFGSVGHGGTLLLNVPLNNEGALDDAIKESILGFADNINRSFQTNLLANESASIQADSVWNNSVTYSPENLVDGDDMTVWSSADGSSSASLLLTLDGKKKYDIISIEEAIQFGQRINSYTVESRASESSAWTTIASGQTIGPKRLIRINPSANTQIRITVSTTDGKTPVLSEVGVYKASEEFQLSGSAPDGMDVIDNLEASSTSGTWKQETGTQFINQTSQWCNAGGEISFTFSGTKAYLMGTTDPNHGMVDIYIDGVKVDSVNTNATTRSLGQILYETDTLSNGEHTLKAVCTSKALGVEALFVINNGNKGMVGIEKSAYTMNEDSTLTGKLVRTGGTAPVTVIVAPNPGSAIQDDYDTEHTEIITFAEGETEKEFTMVTTRNYNKTGDQYYYVELECEDSDVILGFNSSARVTIIDTESSMPTYSEADPFVFPKVVGEENKAEAEYGILDSGDAPAEKRIRISDAEWASNGKFVNWFETGYTASYHYRADRTGTYTVTAQYRSGRPAGENQNELAWSEPNGKITAGSVGTPGDSSASETHTVTFDIQVNELGAGVLVFTGPENKSPQFDCFTVTPKELDPFTETWTVTVPASSNVNGTVTVDKNEASDGDTVHVTVEAKEDYVLTDVIVNGVSYGPKAELDIVVTENTVISAVFDQFTYTEDNRFAFPEELDQPKLLEAEHFILQNVDNNDGNWPLKITPRDASSNGKFVNACDKNDSILLPYTAEPGEYEITLTYRSGSATNQITVSDENGHFETVVKSAGAADGAAADHTAVFTLNITEGGESTLKITSGSMDLNCPQMDCFSIVRKSEPQPPVVDELDYELLDLSIAAAQALNAADYSNASSLAAGIAAATQVRQTAAEQADVDTAARALNQYVMSLRLIPTASKLAALN